MRKRTWIGLGALALLLAAGAAYHLGGDRLVGAVTGESAPAAEQRGERAAPVRVTEVRQKSIRITAETIGTLEAKEELQVTTDAPGIVEEIDFEEGERVEQGELLVALDAAQERARLEAARARRDEIARQLERARTLETSEYATEARVDELEAQLAEAEAEVEIARENLDDRRIEAPFSGLVGLRLVSPGALIEPGTAVTTLTRVDPIEVQFDLPAEFRPRLEVGQTVLASSDAVTDGPARGRLDVIDPDIDPATRTITLEAALPNGENRLLPGMLMDVEVVLEELPDAVVIPEEAILRRGGAAYVFVVGSDDTVQRREVTTGEHRGDEVQVTDGLDGGERIVTAGLQTLRQGQKVRPQAAEQAKKQAGEGA